MAGPAGGRAAGAGEQQVAVEEAFAVKVTDVPLLDGVLLIGPPGIGKTEVVKQKAREEAERLGRKFVDLREAPDEVIEDILRNPDKYYVFYRVVATHIFPEDIGYPVPKNVLVEHLPPKVLAAFAREGARGLLFIDELTNVKDAKQMTMYFSILQEKEAGMQLRLSRGVKIIVAANPPEWSRVAEPLPQPIRGGRVTMVEVLPPTVDEWAQYMERTYGDEWDRAVYAYLKAHPEDFLKQPEDDWSAFPTPRSWTRLARALYELRRSGAPWSVIAAVVKGSVGPEVAPRFLALYKRGEDLSKHLERLKREPESFLQLDHEMKYLVIIALLQRPAEEVLEEFGGFLEWLLKLGNREWLALIVTNPLDPEKGREIGEALSRRHPDYVSALLEMTESFEE
jgi:MoxR-like ATPase